jgi:hypothetical protein
MRPELSFSLFRIRCTGEAAIETKKIDKRGTGKGERGMRFMILRKADNNTERGVLPSENLLAAMGQYMEEMMKAGVLLGGDGLQPSSKGTRVKFSGGKPTIIDGPFAETKELLAGYCVIQVKSKEEALEWVRRWPALEAEDFGPEFTPELREREERLREEVARK